MLRASHLLAASLAAVTLALPAVADARIASTGFEARLEVVATCSVSVARTVDVACASPSTPYLLDTGGAASQPTVSADARQVTVYF